MLSIFLPRRRATASFGLMILVTFSTHSFAADNIWQSTFGQRWFYEVRSYSGEVLAGTWWEQSLSPGKTYRITFNVKKIQGKIGLLVGNNPAVTIQQPGTYGFDFNISADGKRRMLFQTQSIGVIASVDGISVMEAWSGVQYDSGGSGNTLPKGHYLSFDSERNLKTEMLLPLQKPSSVSQWHLNQARDLDEALRTPGIKGMYMGVNWRTMETGDGKFNWSLLDANMEVARKYGLKVIYKIYDRSFDGTNIMPAYFPSQYVLWSSGGGKSGFVAKRWEPYVYNRMIRLYRAIANRYAGNSEFGGIATTETAMGKISSGDYTPAKYRAALTQVVTQTHAAMKRGRLFFYLNFLTGGENIDMNKDMRVALLRDLPHASLVIGAPDVTPDVAGMPRSATAYRLHARRQMPGLSQFCHLQHVDHGEAGINVKNNNHRQKYLDDIARIRSYEQQSWFKGTKAVFELDDLRDPKGNKVTLHPNGVLNQLWKPEELFQFGRRNFDCDYVFWHWRRYAPSSQFSWSDVRPIVLNNQYF